MTPERMIEKAQQQLDIMATIGKDTAEVGFIIPGGSFSERRRKRLFKGGPLGRPAGMAKGGIMCFFDAHEVIAAAKNLQEANDA